MISCRSWGSDLDDIQICGFLRGCHAHGGVDRARLEAACSPEGNSRVFTLGLRVDAEYIVGNTLREAMRTAEPLRHADSSIRASAELVSDSGEVMKFSVTVRGHILVEDRVLLPKEPDWFNRLLETMSRYAIDGRMPANSSSERLEKPSRAEPVDPAKCRVQGGVHIAPATAVRTPLGLVQADHAFGVTVVPRWSRRREGTSLPR
jgi:hypothetical protein